MVYVVMVGALNVGRIQPVMMPEIITNADLHGRSMVPTEYTPPTGSTKLEPGSELGIFYLGSTVVVAFPKAFARKYNIVRNQEFRPIMMGQSII